MTSNECFCCAHCDSATADSLSPFKQSIWPVNWSAASLYDEILLFFFFTTKLINSIAFSEPLFPIFIGTLPLSLLNFYHTLLISIGALITLHGDDVFRRLSLPWTVNSWKKGTKTDSSFNFPTCP